jgi:hypothetical protein
MPLWVLLPFQGTQAVSKSPSKPEKITPPADKLVKQQAKKLPQGGSAASAPGRILVEKKVAKKQGARRANP